MQRTENAGAKRLAAKVERDGRGGAGHRHLHPGVRAAARYSPGTPGGERDAGWRRGALGARRQITRADGDGSGCRASTRSSDAGPAGTLDRDAHAASGADAGAGRVGAGAEAAEYRSRSAARELCRAGVVHHHRIARHDDRCTAPVREGEPTPRAGVHPDWRRRGGCRDRGNCHPDRARKGRAGGNAMGQKPRTRAISAERCIGLPQRARRAPGSPLRRGLVSAVVWCGCDARHEHLVHAVPIHVEHFEA